MNTQTISTRPNLTEKLRTTLRLSDLQTLRDLADYEGDDELSTVINLLIKRRLMSAQGKSTAFARQQAIKAISSAALADMIAD